MTDLFGNDKFDKIFKSALRGADLHIAGKNGNIYTFSDGVNELTADITEIRENFSRDNDHLALSAYSVELSNKFELEKKLSSFTNAQFMLRLLLIPENEAHKGIIYVPFAGNLYKSIAVEDAERGVSFLEDRFLKKWNVPKEVLFSVADRNMGRILSRTKYNFAVVAEGVNVIEFEAQGDDPLTVSFLLCTDFRELAQGKLGENFIAAVPSTETLMASNDISQRLVESLKEAVLKNYSWADNPLTTDIFRFTANGVEVLK